MAWDFPLDALLTVILVMVILGFITYRIIRSIYRQVKHTRFFGHIFCPYCRIRIDNIQPKYVCPRCGFTLKEGKKLSKYFKKPTLSRRALICLIITFLGLSSVLIYGFTSPTPFMFGFEGNDKEGDNISCRLGHTVDIRDGDFVYKEDGDYFDGRIVFSKDTEIEQIRGFLLLDVDGNPSTGRPADSLYGKTSHDLGFEYYIDLGSYQHDKKQVGFYSADGRFIGWVDGNCYQYVSPIGGFSSGEKIFDIIIDDNKHREIHSLLSKSLWISISGIRFFSGVENTGYVVVAMCTDSPQDWFPDQGHEKWEFEPEKNEP